MKKSLICVGLISSALFFSFDSFAQSKNVQDAFSKFKMVSPKNDAEKNLRTLEEAKKFIDAAAENPETKEDPKMHFYRGQIYMSLYELSAQRAIASGSADQTILEGYKSKAAESFIFCLNEPKKKFKDDVIGMAEIKHNFLFESGVKAYNEKNYEVALMSFVQAYEVKHMLNLPAEDAQKNAVIMLREVTSKLTKGENKNDTLALTMLIGMHEVFPTEFTILIDIVNIHLRNNDIISAEKYVAEAVSLEPNNKELYYVLGTSYLTQGLNEKAEESLNKALEIDANYKDAQYQLGAHLYNWANEVNKQAGELNANDPKLPELEKQSEQLLQKSLNVLEKYIEINPNDKDVLGIIYKTHYKLGNTEKGKEYKARFDAQN
jgi:tetratricopeptide (TPR) repeat protein